MDERKGKKGKKREETNSSEIIQNVIYEIRNKSYSIVEICGNLWKPTLIKRILKRILFLDINC